jgi:hypothetical protein
MLLGILVLITALSISAVAIFFSVAGLVAIFPASAVSIIIMGTVLEISKLVTTVWLHRYWDQAVWWLKTYLSVAVIVLMLITSMGIFGFLSKSHIEQTAALESSLLRIEQIDGEIARQSEQVVLWRSEISSLESSPATRDSEIQQQIDAEQTRIDLAFQRVQPLINEQSILIERENARSDRLISDIERQIQASLDRISALDSTLAANNVRAAQAIIGVRQDGRLGPDTERSIESYRRSEEQSRSQLSAQISNIRLESEQIISRSREEISKIREGVERQVSDSNALVNRLRERLGQSNSTETVERITTLREQIELGTQSINSLTEQKINLETQYRTVEAEVGPLKYIAEFIYGDSSNKALLDQAVRWVIIMIIFVFDPLAVLLLIASQHTFVNKKPSSSEILSYNVRNNHDRTNIKNANTSTPDAPDTKKTDGGTAGVDRPEESRIKESSEVLITKTEELERERKLQEYENHEAWKIAKKLWKDQNPGLNLKAFKDDYVKGIIDELPWASLVDYNTDYVQNSEQGPSSLWKTIRSKDG